MKTKPQHAPGPWSVEYNEAIYVKSTYGEAHNERVADVHGEDTPQRVANARLIAAAPDLLEALTALIDAASWSPTDNWRIGPMDSSKGGKMDKARAAIAKATGTH